MIPYYCSFPPNVQFPITLPSIYYGNLPKFTSNDQNYFMILGTQPVNQVNHNQKICITKQDLLGQPYHSSKKPWTEEEDSKMCDLIQKYRLRWGEISRKMKGRTYKMCYSRYRRIKNTEKQAWTKQEDKKIEELVSLVGKSWKKIHFQHPKRTAKQIRERYINFIRPNISQDDWTVEEDLKLVELINKFGQKWKKIEEGLGVRTQNQIKNRYFSRILKLWRKLQEGSFPHKNNPLI